MQRYSIVTLLKVKVYDVTCMTILKKRYFKLDLTNFDHLVVTSDIPAAPQTFFSMNSVINVVYYHK